MAWGRHQMVQKSCLQEASSLDDGAGLITDKLNVVADLKPDIISGKQEAW